MFVGAPADGSVFLNSMKLWAMREAGLIDSTISIWICTLKSSKHAPTIAGACSKATRRRLATFILGGGVPKNYNLQPEPALGQVLGLPDVRGYQFDVQITTAPVTDGSLSSCPPAEAVTWGKVDKDTYLQTTESMQGDYSMVMPFLALALLETRKNYEKKREQIGEEKLFREEPRARGYLRNSAGYRLYERRDELTAKLLNDVKNNAEWLNQSIEVHSASGK